MSYGIRHAFIEEIMSKFSDVGKRDTLSKPV